GHPDLGLPEFGILSWPKSDKSDFGWRGGEGVSTFPRSCRVPPPCLPRKRGRSAPSARRSCAKRRQQDQGQRRLLIVNPQSCPLGGPADFAGPSNIRRPTWLTRAFTSSQLSTFRPTRSRSAHPRSPR